MIRLPYFGKFSVKSKRVEYINKLKDESKRWFNSHNR
jgi:hypothetical protein